MKNISEKLKHEGCKYIVVRGYRGKEEIVVYTGSFSIAKEHVKRNVNKDTEGSYSIHELAGNYWIFN